jgi:epoxyqueuosine reductase
MSLTERICERAHDLGFDLVGIAPARPTPHLEAYHSWLGQGYHGEMGYLARPDRVERRKDPARIVPGVRSIICVGLNYWPGALPADLLGDPSRGLISNYAWGLDYHDLMMPRLEELAAFVGAEAGAEAGRGITHRAYVDTGPVLERAYAAEAGLGFVGKNTCLIHPKLGSWLFLGEILLDVEIAPPAGMEIRPTTRRVSGSCGTCRRCLDACPTGALVAPYTLDARRCISYLTIELKGPIPIELRPLMGNRIYGCDVCQAVCPWQRFARPTQERSFQATGPDHAAPVLSDLIGMSEEAFHRQYEGTPVLRTGRQRLLRNVAVALGNCKDSQAAPVLTRALTDVAPLVRGHAAWALGRVGGQTVRKTLEGAWQRERDPYVKQEIQRAMSAGSLPHSC